MLPIVGKAAQLKAAREAAESDIETWRAGKVDGIDRQLSALRTSMMAQADKSLPTTTDLQVTNMVTRLSDFDPLEVEILYADATDAERRIIEAASSAIGRQPVRVGDKLVWQALISPDRISETIAARAERARPEGAAQLRDLQRIRNTFDAMGSVAQGLLRGIG